MELALPMYHAHPYFSLKNLGKKCSFYMAKYGTHKMWRRAGVQNQGHCHAPSTGNGGEAFPCLFWLLRAASIPQLRAASFQSLPSSLHHPLLCRSVSNRHLCPSYQDSFDGILGPPG